MENEQPNLPKSLWPLSNSLKAAARATGEPCVPSAPNGHHPHSTEGMHQGSKKSVSLATAILEGAGRDDFFDL